MSFVSQVSLMSPKIFVNLVSVTSLMNCESRESDESGKNVESGESLGLESQVSHSTVS